MNYQHFSQKLLCVLTVATVGVSASLHAQTYHVTDLGTINTQNGVISSHPTGINNVGQVSGYSFSGTSNHAARFTNGVVDDLGTIPGGITSQGFAINNLGQVVGDSEYSPNGGSIRHAALFSNGTAEERLIGRRASYGCIRMKSKDVIALYHQVHIGTPVKIVEVPLAALLPAEEPTLLARQD